MDRSIQYPGAKYRGFDFATGFADAETSLGIAIEAVLGSTAEVYNTGGNVTPGTGLAVTISAGTFLGPTEIDPTAIGSIPQDTNTNYVAVRTGAVTLPLSPPSMTSGQSAIALISWSIGTVDGVRDNDPSSGLLSFVNSANPVPGAAPLLGPGGDNTTLNTVRRRTVNFAVTWSAAASSPSIPPTPAGSAVLATVEVPAGATSISPGQIIQGPFLTGLLNSHHIGTSGSAPKIQLTNATEVQGQLPMANLLASDSIGFVPAMQMCIGQNPNGVLAGNSAGSAFPYAPPSLAWDGSRIWACATTGNASTAVWHTAASGSLLATNLYTGTGSITLSPACNMIVGRAVGGGGSGCGIPAGTSGAFATSSGAGAGAYQEFVLYNVRGSTFAYACQAAPAGGGIGLNGNAGGSAVLNRYYGGNTYSVVNLLGGGGSLYSGPQGSSANYTGSGSDGGGFAQPNDPNIGIIVIGNGASGANPVLISGVNSPGLGANSPLGSGGGNSNAGLGGAPSGYGSGAGGGGVSGTLPNTGANGAPGSPAAIILFQYS